MPENVLENVKSMSSISIRVSLVRNYPHKWKEPMPSAWARTPDANR